MSANAELLAAVNAGIAEATPPGVVEATETEDTENEPTESTLSDVPEDPTDGDEGDAAADAGEDDESDAAKPEEAETGSESGEDEAGSKGAPGEAGAKPGEGEAKPAETKPAETSATEVTADPVNDPIPPNMKQATRNRVQSLIDIVKEERGSRERIEATHSEFIQHIESTGATPQQYGDALQYLRMVNSSDPATLEQALQVMQREMVAIAQRIGKPVPGIDFTSRHADLQQAVVAGQITPLAAQELAALRERQQFDDQVAALTTRRREESTGEMQLRQHGVQQLNELEQQLRRADPHYEQKAAMITEALKPVFKTIDPRKWRDTFAAAYARLPNPAPATAAVSKSTGAPVNQPLRATNPSGGSGMKKEPKTLKDAIMGIDFSQVK